MYVRLGNNSTTPEDEIYLEIRIEKKKHDSRSTGNPSELEIESIVKTVAAANLTSSDIWVCQFLISSLDIAGEALTDNKVHLKSLEFLEKTDLNDVSVKSFTFALRTVANLVSGTSGLCCLNVISNLNLSLERITQKIFSSPYPHLVPDLGWFLGNIINHPTQHLKESVLTVHNLDFESFESQLSILLNR